MFSSKYLSALAAATWLSLALAQKTTGASSSIELIPTPSAQQPASEIVSIGCFKTSTPLENHGPYEFQSEGNCQQICIQLGKKVMGLSDGTDCWCGDLIPPKSAKVGNDSCETTCAGIKTDFCGGDQHLWVDLTGVTRNKVQYYEPEASSSTSSSSSAAKTSAEAVETAVVTQSSEPKEESSGPNKVGIAVGVVVGVLALAGIIGGALLYLRQKRRREVEEEYRRQAAVNSFVAGGKLHTSNSSMTDSRLDPEFNSRRQSNGSIADNEDYSRRILKVTNA